jgi:hypothetical protein
MDKTHEQIAQEFLNELEKAIDEHRRAYWKDAFLYQFIVIASAICGLISLYFGASRGDPVLAGVFGGVTTIGSFLTQTLHCAKAQGWQDHMKTELEGIRVQFVYENASAPTPEALSDLARQYRDLKSRMSQEWERIISSGSGGLSLRLPRTRTSAERR